VSTTTHCRSVDVVIVGLGWVGGIMAAELTRAGLEVVALERGPSWSRERGDFDRVQDELDARRRRFMQDVAHETWTFRHHLREDALPIRRLGAFTPGSGVGGSSLLYGARLGRLDPWDFHSRTAIAEQFGEEVMPEGSILSDWPLSYEELAPYYDRFEETVGAGGVAGNLNGERREHGNPFEGPRSAEYPLPPAKVPPGPAIFAEAARSLGYHPSPIPSGIGTHPYTNSYGVSRPACTYCGFCITHPCQTGAKADATTTVIPAAVATGLLEIRDRSYVLDVIHDGRRARGVRYVDAAGDVREQAAEIVILAAYSFGNVRLLLLSGMGEPYEPSSGSGQVGRSYGYNISIGLTALYEDRTFNSYMGGPSNGFLMDDCLGSNLDPREVGFVGGGYIHSSHTGAALLGRIAVPDGTPRWGAGWKAAIRDWYDRDVRVKAGGQTLPYRDISMDLDPRYTDGLGRPLLRLTFDWKPNERRLARFLELRLREILARMEPTAIAGSAELPEHFDTTSYQGTHNTGGAVMGSNPGDSLVNSWLQMWEFDNVWVVGGSAFPQGAAHGPTGTICALAYRAADGITQYARSPGPLA
jgi:gluconate 2-dehydrogenase alpha chain